jgi:hypothetical protein
MEGAVQKLTVAMQRLRDLCWSDIEETYMSDDGVLEFERLRTVIATTLARREVQEQAQQHQQEPIEHVVPMEDI